jgi:hypothetical protein
MSFSLDELTNIAIGSARGAKRQPTFMSYQRDLNKGDLDLVQNPPEKGILTNPVVRLRNSHHMLARLLAAGRRPGECALMTGYSPSRISILQNDPAFQDLLAYYSANTEAKYLDVHERLATLGLASIDELQERLEENPDKFGNKDLLALAEFSMDRSVTKDQRKTGGGGTPSISVTFVGQAATPPVLPHGGPQSTPLPSFSRPQVIDLDGEALPPSAASDAS